MLRNGNEIEIRFGKNIATCQNERRANEDRLFSSVLELPELLSDQQWTRSLTEVVAKLQTEIDQLKLTGGSTLCAVIADASTFRIVNVGDSRAHLVILDKASGESVPITIRNGQIEYDANSKSHGLLLHKLHKPEISTEDLKNQLKCNSNNIPEILDAIAQSGLEKHYPETCAVIKGGGRVDCRKNKSLYLNNGIAISRALGDKKVFDKFSEQKNSIFHMPDVITLRLNWNTFPNDAKSYKVFTIVGTDGLTDGLTANRIAAEIVEPSCDKHIAVNLIRAAVERGSEDNITVVVLESGAQMKVGIVADGHIDESVAEHIKKNFLKHAKHFLKVACQEIAPNRICFITRLSELVKEDLAYVGGHIADALNSMLTIMGESKTEKEKITGLLNTFAGWKSNSDSQIFLPTLIKRYSPIFAVLSKGQFAGSKFDDAISQMQQLAKESSTFYASLKQQCEGLFKEKREKFADLKAQHSENKKDDKRNLNYFKFLPSPSVGVRAVSSTEKSRRNTI